MIDSAKIGCAIAVPGMISATLDSFIIDDDWLLHHLDPEPLFIPLILPRNSKITWDGWAQSLSGETAPFAEAATFSNCISYDHEVPTVVQPAARGWAPSYEAVGFSRPWIDTGLEYTESLSVASEAATGIRFTDGLCFRYSENEELTEFSRRFAGMVKPLAMYAMALRQVDLLTEYLCLYRICEWADHGNGVRYINENVDAISSHNFGTLWIENATLDRDRERVNVFEVYRERAIARLEVLRTSNVANIGRHLYQYRNGVAHGKTEVLVHDFGANVDAIAAELPLIRLICRMIIDGGAAGRRTRLR